LQSLFNAMPYCASWLVQSKGFAQEPYRISPEMLFTVQFFDRPNYVCCSSAIVPIQPHPPRFTLPLLDLPQRGIPRQAPPSSTKGSAKWTQTHSTCAQAGKMVADSFCGGMMLETSEIAKNDPTQKKTTRMRRAMMRQ
jgi:hypothetical protein